jgi:hypothetical protein
MSIEIPQRGQPIDYNYIYKIVEQINLLTAAVAPRASDSKFSNGTDSATLRTANMTVVAGYQDVNQLAKTEDLNSHETKSYPFGVTFKYPPIVTITPVAKDSSLASKNVAVTILSTTTTEVTYTVKFNTAGDATFGVNILAAGVPVIY